MHKNVIAFVIRLAAGCAASVMLLAASVGARAQSEGTFKELNVSLWPEYDRPGVLVIYRIVLPDNTSLPAELTVRIPASATLNAVASLQADGKLLNAPYEQVVKGDWAEISFTTTMPGSQIEYYDASLTRDGKLRKYRYSWPGDYAIDALGIEVQQPLGATNMVTSPDLGSGKTREDSLTYYTANIGSLPQGQEFDLSLQYEKSDETLSAAGLGVQPSIPVEDDAEGWRSWLTTALPWVVAALGLALIVGGGVWYWRSRKRKAERREPRRRRKPSTAAERATVAAPPAGQPVYCHSCGNRASQGDRFCRTCGTALRSH